MQPWRTGAAAPTSFKSSTTHRSTRWLVIGAIQPKYPAMAARSLALALGLLLCVTAAGWAAEPAPATVVLQLPPLMSPDSVKSLISDLAAKGVQPTAPPSDTPDAASRL